MLGSTVELPLRAAGSYERFDRAAALPKSVSAHNSVPPILANGLSLLYSR